jgi:hypothetical protein
MEYLVILIVLLLGILVGIIFNNKFNLKFTKKNTNININSTVKEILPIAEYLSLVYHYSDVITHSDINKIFDINIPLTEKKAIYTIEGTIKLGFNGKNIKTSISYNNVIVQMPKIEILSHEVYPETFKLYDEKTSLFNKYSLKDANDIQMIHRKEREIKINENTGLYTQARESAEQQFKIFLENIPVIKEKYKIVFEWEY